MKAITLVGVIVGGMALPSVLLSQQPDPLSFFPHHTGDIWEYGGVSPPHHVWQERILEDSIGPDGRHYISHSYYGRLRVDTSSFEVRGAIGSSDNYEILFYKLDADLGGAWVRQRQSGNAKIAQVVGVYESFFWGTLRTVKRIDITDSASGLLFLTDYLVSGLGLVGQDIDAFPDGWLTGAIIDGVEYGTITLPVQEQDPTVGHSFVLAHNYPNPFNSSTEFNFDLPEAGNVSLVIYDILGRQIAELVNGAHDAGFHSASWNAAGQASGVYLARFSVVDVKGRQVYAKINKLVLMK